MIWPTRLTGAYPFGGKLAAKFPRVSAHLHPLCLTYLTYIYIYYRGSGRGRAHPLGSSLTSLLGEKLGNVGQRIVKPTKYVGQPGLFGWAVPILVGQEAIPCG